MSRHLPCPFCGGQLGRAHPADCYLRLLAEYRSDHKVSGAQLDEAWNKRISGPTPESARIIILENLCNQMADTMRGLLDPRVQSQHVSAAHDLLFCVDKTIAPHRAPNPELNRPAETTHEYT